MGDLLFWEQKWEINSGLVLECLFMLIPLEGLKLFRVIFVYFNNNIRNTPTWASPHTGAHIYIHGLRPSADNLPGDRQTLFLSRCPFVTRALTKDAFSAGQCRSGLNKGNKDVTIKF